MKLDHKVIHDRFINVNERPAGGNSLSDDDLNVASDRSPFDGNLTLDAMRAAIAELEAWREKQPDPVAYIAVALDVYAAIPRRTIERSFGEPLVLSQLRMGIEIRPVASMRPGTWRAFRRNRDGREYPAEGNELARDGGDHA